jgi:hypothetical protein
MPVTNWKQKKSASGKNQDILESVLHGSAYVHGDMNGRAMDKQEAGEIKAQTFKLY